MSALAQMDPQYSLWLDLYPGLKALPALLRELIALEASQSPALAPEPVDLNPVLERLLEALGGLSVPASPSLDLEPLAERLDALLEETKKSGKLPAGMFSSTGGRAASIVDDNGHTAAISNAAPAGTEYGLLVRTIGGSGSSDVSDRATRLLGHVTVDSAPAVTGAVAVTNFPATQPVSDASVPNLVGTWGYLAGSAGTRTVPAATRVIGITAHATTAGSMTINGGDSLPIPANSSIVFQPNGQLVAPTIVFSGTDSYAIETLA